jgi:hypothetical protein
VPGLPCAFSELEGAAEFAPPGPAFAALGLQPNQRPRKRASAKRMAKRLPITIARKSTGLQQEDGAAFLPLFADDFPPFEGGELSSRARRALRSARDEATCVC